MTDRGNGTHSPRVDDQLAHEAQPIVQGHGEAHVEEWYQSEPMPDDTDSAEVRDAAGVTGELADAPEGVVDAEPATDADGPLYTSDTAEGGAEAGDEIADRVDDEVVEQASRDADS